jgi:hypothetical protein
MMSSASADKVREMSEAERNRVLSDLCDHVGIAEDIKERGKFYYSLLAWIYKNTASSKHAEDSSVFGQSSLKIVEFFDRDMRPFARASATDAKKFIRYVVQSKAHPLHADFVRIATAAGTPRDPELAYDGITATSLPEGHYRLANSIRDKRLREMEENAAARDVPRGTR